MTYKKSDWVWMPHAGHFICSHDCRFFLTTRVGGFIVSTVGEYLPDETVREITAKHQGVVLEGQGDARRADFLKKIGYLEVGYGRKYETMVFVAKPSDNPCCPFMAASWDEHDFAGYMEPGDAYRGHLAMCEKWSGEDHAKA